MVHGRFDVALNFEGVGEIQLDFRQLRSNQFGLTKYLQGFSKFSLLLTYKCALHPQLRDRGISRQSFYKGLLGFLQLS